MINSNIAGLLQELISFDTTSCKSNLEFIGFCSKYLQSHGVEVELVTNAEGTKANLWATIGPAVDGGIVFSGHTDCVPVDGQAWSSDPFVMTERDGRLYGRGSADMKGFIACVLAIVPEIRRLPLSRPLHLAFSYDEEVGLIGVRDMLSYVIGKDIHPGFCVVGEPTSMSVVNGHKGGRLYECIVTGLEMHSSLTPLGVNAIQYAARLISHITTVASELSSSEFDQDFDVPHSTLSTGMVEGGTAGNIIPNKCKFIFDIRNIPNSSQDKIFETIENFAKNSLTPEMQDVNRDCGIEFKELSSYPGHSIDSEDPMVTRAMKFLGCCQNRKVAFGTEAGLYQEQLKVPTIICGPGDIAFAHKSDEFVPISDLDACFKFLMAMTHTLL